MESRPRILVADDHPMMLAGVSKKLSELPADVVAALSPEEAISLLEHHAFDLAVLDIQFRDSKLTGFHILAVARRIHPQMPVLMASVFDDGFLQDKARQDGARGFLSKNGSIAVWRDGVTAALRGETCFSASHRTESGGKHLTSRELEVTLLIGTGLNQDEAAAELEIRRSAVEKHIREAKKRMSVRSTAQLMWDFVLRGLHLLPREEREPSPPPRTRIRTTSRLLDRPA
jgi:DNA-binding NarL/FixJ family response regulator